MADSPIFFLPAFFLAGICPKLVSRFAQFKVLPKLGDRLHSIEIRCSKNVASTFWSEVRKK